MGRQQYLASQVDFAVSDVPFSPEELLLAEQRPFVYAPVLAGGIALMYNLRDRGVNQ